MKIIPKAITTLTKATVAVAVVIAIMLSLTAGKYFLWIFLPILGGPFSIGGFYSGIPGVVPSGRLSLFEVVCYVIPLGVGNLLMILSHSYKQSITTAFLTILGCLFWLLLGANVAFMSV